MFAAMFQVRAFYWGWWRSASNLFKVCESVLHACTCTHEIMILLGLFSASHIHRQQCCYTATPRVTVREEEATLNKDTQTETSSPVCSHNEWDPLEVKKERRDEWRLSV